LFSLEKIHSSFHEVNGNIKVKFLLQGRTGDFSDRRLNKPMICWGEKDNCKCNESDFVSVNKLQQQATDSIRHFKESE